jgi:hypothetical protein
VELVCCLQYTPRVFTIPAPCSAYYTSSIRFANSWKLVVLIVTIMQQIIMMALITSDIKLFQICGPLPDNRIPKTRGKGHVASKIVKHPMITDTERFRTVFSHSTLIYSFPLSSFTECKYILLKCGIPAKHLPFNEEGESQIEWHQNWLNKVIQS